MYVGGGRGEERGGRRDGIVREMRDGIVREMEGERKWMGWKRGKGKGRAMECSTAALGVW